MGRKTTERQSRQPVGPGRRFARGSEHGQGDSPSQRRDGSAARRRVGDAADFPVGHRRGSPRGLSEPLATPRRGRSESTPGGLILPDATGGLNSRGRDRVQETIPARWPMVFVWLHLGRARTHRSDRARHGRAPVRRRSGALTGTRQTTGRGSPGGQHSFVARRGSHGGHRRPRSRDPARRTAQRVRVRTPCCWPALPQGSRSVQKAALVTEVPADLPLKDENVVAAAWTQPEPGPDGRMPPQRKLDLELSPRLPGSEAPRIVLPRDPAERQRVIDRLYPDLAPLPVEPKPQPGPGGKPYTLEELQRLAAANSPTIVQAASDVQAARAT